MLVFEPFVVVRLAAPFTIPQKISIAERKGVTSLDSLKASVKVPWSCPRLAIKLIGNLERRRNKEREAARAIARQHGDCNVLQPDWQLQFGICTALSTAMSGIYASD